MLPETSDSDSDGGKDDFPGFDSEELEKLTGMSMNELANTDIKSLNRILRRKKIPTEKRKKIKDLRRRLKNRSHAKNQRMRKEEEADNQSEANEIVRQRINDILIKTIQAKEEQKYLQELYNKVDTDVQHLKNLMKTEETEKDSTSPNQAKTDDTATNDEQDSTISKLLVARPGLSIQRV